MSNKNRQPSICAQMIEIWVTGILLAAVYPVAIAVFPLIIESILYIVRIERGVDFLPLWIRNTFYGAAGGLFVAFIAGGNAFDIPRTSIIAYAGEPGVIKTPVRGIICVIISLLSYGSCLWLISRYFA